MKHLFLSALALALSTAHADRLPSQLPDGKYDMTCTDIRISKREGEDQKRTATISRGTVIASSFENVYTERQSVTEYEKDGSGARAQAEGSMKVTLKPLAKDYYLRTIENEYRWAYDGNYGSGYEQEAYKKDTYATVTRVENGFEINIKRSINGGAPEDSVSESYAVTLPDGSIEVTSYLREPSNSPARTTEEGYEVKASTSIVLNSVCRFKPAL